MSEQNNIPENDRDFLLAKEIGKSLNKSGFVSEETDELIPLLNRYKDSQENAAPNSSTLWEHIDEQTRPAKILQLSRKAWFTAAAVILIAAFIGVFTMNQPTERVLIGSTESVLQTITLPDGSNVTLRPNSKLYQIQDYDKRAYAIDGEGYFDVISNAQLTFSVEAGDGTITVIGTQFNVSTWGRSTKVFLKEGSIKLRSSKRNELTLSPGEYTEIIDGKIGEVTTPEEDVSVDWMKNNLIFTGLSITEIENELEHHYGIILDLSQLDSNTDLSGSLRLSELTQTLSDLALVLGGSFQQDNMQTYTFIPME
jgi:transmembrane sensor